jgi:hypothetical protein
MSNPVVVCGITETATMAEKKKEKEPLPKVQTLFPKELATIYKMEALRRGVNVKELYADAWKEFVEDRKAIIKKTGRTPHYRVPTDSMPIPGYEKPTKPAAKGKKGSGKHILNAEVVPPDFEEIKQVADTDNMSNSTVLYTALMFYAEKKRLY